MGSMQYCLQSTPVLRLSESKGMKLEDLPGSTGAINDIGVASILAALFCVHGYENVIQQI